MSSGLHSSLYLQSAIALSYPKYLKIIAQELVDIIKNNVKVSEVDLVVSPAMGGVIIGSKVGELLNKQAVFLERVNNKLVLRRGFSINKKSKILIIEDVITTGKSSKECIAAIKKYKSIVVGVFSIIDRSMKKIEIKAPKYSLVNIKAPLYKKNNLPPFLKRLPLSKPGSRFIK